VRQRERQKIEVREGDSSVEGIPTITAMIKNTSPMPIAMPLMIFTNLSSSCFMRVSGFSPCVVFVAMTPIAVWSPVRTTTPLPTPSVQLVLKKATLLTRGGDIKRRHQASHGHRQREQGVLPCAMWSFICHDWTSLLRLTLTSKT
jgi:hypothetical protein